MKSLVRRAIGKARRVAFAKPTPSTEVPGERIHLVTCIGVELETPLIGHFVAHYLALGIPPANFHIVLNTADAQSPALDRAREALANAGVAVEEVWIAPYTSRAMWQKRRDVQRRCVPKSHWVISADTDELHEYPDRLGAVLAACETHGVNCIDGVFVDRVAADGTLAEASATPPLARQFPVQAMVQGQIVAFGAFHQPVGSVKLMAFDAALLPDQGGHRLVKHQGDARYIFGRSLSEYPQIVLPALRFRLPFQVHHFKWRKSLLATLAQRLDAVGVSAPGREYGQRLVDYFARTDDRIVFADVVIKSPCEAALDPSWRAKVRMMRGAHLARLAGSRIKSPLG